MKNFIKRIMPVYVISLVLSFMLYIYEPITMYLTNVNDFWFDINIIIKPLIIYSLCLFLGISILFTIIYLINRIFSKKAIVYNILVLVLFIGFVCLYIQGNFLVSNLPSLDGTVINWENYTTDSIISIILWVVVIGIIIFTSIKFKMENVIKTCTFISLAILFMLGSSLTTTLLQSDLKKKETPVSYTIKNYNNASTNKNFFIFLVDAVDSVMFDEVMSSDPDFKNTFDDFTYYKDTISLYPYTRDSIPYILTGILNDNKDDFRTYSTKAYNNSKLLNKLKELGYERNLYETELIWEDEKIKDIDNIVSVNGDFDFISYFKEQTKYLLFKYLPYPLKKYSKIEYMDFNRCKKISGLYEWTNTFNYDLIRNEKIVKQDKDVFSFYHLQGAHIPCFYNKKLEITENDSYYETLAGNVTLIDSFIKRLKEADVYDNSVIIILSDHGFALGNGPVGRQNPILFIKGIDEHHEMIRSNLPISYEDLSVAYDNLLDGRTGEDVFYNISKKRKRRLLWYEYMKEDHMVEYIQEGKAWDEKTLKKTGKEFNR